MSGGRRGERPPLIDSCAKQAVTRRCETETVTPDGDPVDELATALFGLKVEGRSTAQVTAYITREIINWAVAHGWSPRTEARVHAPSSAGDARLGFVDVIVRRGSGVPDVAIEIDSADKPWSLDKLRHAAAAGMHAIWVRWGDDEWAGAYQDIDVIQLRLLRLPRSLAGTDDQLALWR
jgi:hypothetical protein